MKKEYETPEVKKIDFDYKENVVASTTVKSNKEVQTSTTRCVIPCRVCQVTTESPY